MFARRTLIVILMTLVGCTRDAPRVAPSERPVDVTPVSPAPQAPAVGTPPPAMGMQPSAAAAEPRVELSGTVVETMNAASYTYAKLDKGTGAVWVAGPETKLAVGMKIGATSGTLMTAFHSTTLDRTFDEIYFIASFPIVGSAPPNPHAETGAPAPIATMQMIEKVTPAPGGQTIAQVFAGKRELVGKPVVVRGKVVKVNNGILGHNWLHIQDGSGSPGTNDLTITTAATVSLGDIVVVRGNVATDKDFGAGYKYDVLVENAAIAAR